MKLIQERKRIRCTNRHRSFEYKGYQGWGFAFPCDKEGNPIDLAPPAEENFRKCLTGEVNGRKVIDKGVKESHHSYTQPAIGRCECGGEVTLEHFTNRCGKCGAYYNSSGQRLSDPSTWGEETGEHPADILQIP